MTHLTLESWRQVQAGTLPEVERAAVLQHLSERCERCDSLVAELDDPSLDGALDAVLTRLPPGHEAPRSLLFERIERRVLAQALGSRSGRRWVLAAPLALAAGAALFVAWPAGTPDEGQRLKGEALRPPALSAMVAPQPGGPLARFEPSGTYPSTAELYFSYELPADGYAYLGRVGVDGVVEPFYPPRGNSHQVERAGLHPLLVGGAVHAYSLEGLRGRQRFVLVTSARPLDEPALRRALADQTAVWLELEIGDR